MSGKSNFEIAAEQGYCGELPPGHPTHPVRLVKDEDEDEARDADEDMNKDE